MTRSERVNTIDILADLEDDTPVILKLVGGHTVTGRIAATLCHPKDGICLIPDDERLDAGDGPVDYVPFGSIVAFRW